MQNITADVFIQTLFPPELLADDERPVIACPDSFISRETGERVDFFRQFHYRPGCFIEERSEYFCVSTVRRQRVRQVKKALADVRTAMVLALDDIGTKAVAPGVAPSYMLETSRGNYQWGYLIEPFDVSTVEGQAYYDACLVALIAAGHCDPGFRSATRLARVPGSLHHTGWCAKVRRWEPGRTWELEALMADFGVKPAPRAAARRERVPGQYERHWDVTDPIYRWLVEKGWTNGLGMGYGGKDWLGVACPWQANHTDGLAGSASSTVFSPYDYGSFRERAFKCHHGHCQGLGIAQFEEWARSQGADITTPEAPDAAAVLATLRPQ